MAVIFFVDIIWREVMGINYKISSGWEVFLIFWPIKSSFFIIFSVHSLVSEFHILYVEPTELTHLYTRTHSYTCKYAFLTLSLSGIFWYLWRQILQQGSCTKHHPCLGTYNKVVTVGGSFALFCFFKICWLVISKFNLCKNKFCPQTGQRIVWCTQLLQLKANFQ